jgi:hypothetical protein
MLLIMLFCICVTLLCCYTVHVMLQDYSKVNSLAYNQIVEKDKTALTKPLKIIVKHEHSFSQYEFKNPKKSETFEQFLNVTPIKKSLANNYYPIKPKNLMSTGYGFDVRA